MIHKRDNDTMRHLITVLLLLLPALAAAVESHAVVFMYHRFGEERYPSTSVRIDQFEAYLDWLDTVKSGKAAEPPSPESDESGDPPAEPDERDRPG